MSVVQYTDDDRNGDLARYESSEGEHRTVFGKTANLFAVVAALFPPTAQLLFAGLGNDAPFPHSDFGRHGILPVVSLLSGKRPTQLEHIEGFLKLRVDSSATRSSIRFRERPCEKRSGALPLTA